jgi:diguanylate cyclase (GGDEF)-like protein
MERPIVQTGKALSDGETSVEELTAQLENTRRQLSDITGEATRNDAKLRRTQLRELQLMQADNLDSLLRVLVDGLRASYDLEYVSVVLCDPDHDIRRLLLADGTPVGDFPNLLIVESLNGLAPQYVALGQPWLGPFKETEHQAICPGATGSRSIAMIPLKHRERVIGSINLCSNNAARYTQDHASDFLAHLGVIASYCLENTVNRARLLRSGYTDVLTGWNNRRYFSDRLGEELARARHDQLGIFCLMLDVDYFKRLNDTWGHAAGDAVLREIAQRIDTHVRTSDVAARYGGEEFVILMLNTDAPSAKLLAERVRAAISATPFDLPSGDTVSVTVSIGISEVQPAPDAEDLKTIGDSLVARADVALYDAKSAGRDRVMVEAA